MHIRPSVIQIGTFFLLIGLLVTAFQNCSQVKQGSGETSSSTTQMGGIGIDGKVYASYGNCADSVDVRERIVVSPGRQSARFVRKDCQDLGSPVVIDLATLQFSKDGSVIKSQEKVYDLQVEGHINYQPVTNKFCHSTTGAARTEVKIWHRYRQQDVLFGSVTTDQVATGTLVVRRSAADRYRTGPNQSSQTDLSVSGATASLNYSLAPSSGSSTVTDLQCGTQSLPPPLPITPAGLAPPNGYSSALLTFEDRFLSSALDSSKWIPQIASEGGIWDGGLPAPYSATGDFNTAFYDPEHVVTGSGLHLIATRDSTFPRYTWRSGSVTTHGLFTFRGGYVQIRARMPDSRSGMWPTLFFLEGGPQIGLAGSGYLGSVDPNRIISSRLAAPGNNEQHFDLGSDLSADYHVYGMEYRPGVSVSIYIDGVLKTTFTSNVPTGAYTIAMLLQVSQGASSWHTSVSDITPSPSVFSISDVQVYRLPP